MPCHAMPLPSAVHGAAILDAVVCEAEVSFCTLKTRHINLISVEGDVSQSTNENRITTLSVPFVLHCFRLLRSYGRRASSIGRAVSPKSMYLLILQGLEQIKFLRSARAPAGCFLPVVALSPHQHLDRLRDWSVLSVSYFVGLHDCCVDYVNVALLSLYL